MKGIHLAFSAILVLSMVLMACAPAASPTPTAAPKATVAPAASPATTGATSTAKPAGTAVPAATPAAKASTPAAADPNHEASLVEAAKKEMQSGPLMIYTTQSDEPFLQFIKPFTTKYPFVKIEKWGGGDTDEIATRLAAEAAAGRNIADVLVSSDGVFQAGRTDLLMKYDYPAVKDLPPELQAPGGLGMPEMINVSVMAYNTNLVPKDQAPRNWGDILDPKYKGQIAIDVGAFEFLDMLRIAMGKEKAVDYLTKLAANQPLLKKGHSAMAEMLAAGEVKVIAEVFLFQVNRYKNRGAPIEWVRSDPIIGRKSFSGIAANAPHPNAAKLFMDWWGSQEGQDTYERSDGKFAPKGSGFAEATKGLNLKIAGLERFEYSKEDQELYSKIFQLK